MVPASTLTGITTAMRSPWQDHRPACGSGSPPKTRTATKARTLTEHVIAARRDFFSTRTIFVAEADRKSRKFSGATGKQVLLIGLLGRGFYSAADPCKLLPSYGSDSASSARSGQMIKSPIPIGYKKQCWPREKNPCRHLHAFAKA